MKATQRATVSATSDLYTDQRVRKVCEFLVANGFEVTLVGQKRRNSSPLPATAYRTKRFSVWFEKGPLFYAAYNLRLLFYLLFRTSDLLVANDLDTLYANCWAKKFKRKCRLVYDAHEYYCETPELIHRPRVQRIWRSIERWCLPQVDAMYTVNASIAHLYATDYGKKAEVVRNITDIPVVATTKCRADLGLPEDRHIVILQGAGINRERGAEELIKALPLVRNAVLLIVGSGDVVPQLKIMVEQMHLEDKVLFFDKQPYDQLMHFTALSDVGVSLDKDTNLNYRFSLPNKVFDYIHAGIPLLVSDLTEVKAIVEQYAIGLVCPSHEPAVIANRLTTLLTDKALYDQCKRNTRKAKEALNWQRETAVLRKVYLRDAIIPKNKTSN